MAVGAVEHSQHVEAADGVRRVQKPLLLRGGRRAAEPIENLHRLRFRQALDPQNLFDERLRERARLEVETPCENPWLSIVAAAHPGAIMNNLKEENSHLGGDGLFPRYFIE